MQRAAGLYGSLIVEVADGEEEPFHYDGEFNLLLSDWYHQSIYDQMVGLSSKPFRWIGEPQVSDASFSLENDSSINLHYATVISYKKRKTKPRLSFFNWLD